MGFCTADNLNAYNATSVDKEKVVSVLLKCKNNKNFLKIKSKSTPGSYTLMGSIYYYFYHITITLKCGKKN